MILYILGSILKAEAVLLLLPMIVGVIYGERSSSAFLITILITLALGFLMSIKRPKNKTIYAREGFVVVALAWIVMSLTGALPFTISGAIPSYIDAFFETVSGFTTTGSTILSEVEALPKCMLFWRSFTHWIGGMGVLVFVLAIVPLADEHSMHLMRAEVPGPQVGKLVPRIKNTAMILYGLYIVLTIIEILLLLLGGMSFFDSVVNSFATAGTGGFSIRNASIAAYDSVYAEIVMTVFMALFGINFNLMFFLAIGRFKDAIKSEELRVYIGIIAAATILITLNILPLYDSFGQALRYSSFQVSSVITTTGFITANYELWPQFSQIILLIVMFIGACAGSTGGGLKISRIIIMVKSMLREIMGLSHRRLIKNVRFEGKTVDEEVVRGVNTYFTIYCILFILFVLVVSLDGFDFKTTVSSVITCINNVGPGLGIVGPVGNFSRFSGFNKLVLSLAMLTGRLEIFPIIMLFTPSVWKGLIKVNRQHNSNNKTNMI